MLQQVYQISPANQFKPGNFYEPTGKKQRDTSENVSKNKSYAQGAFALVSRQIEHHGGKHRSIINWKQPFNQNEVKNNQQSRFGVGLKKLWKEIWNNVQLGLFISGKITAILI